MALANGLTAARMLEIEQSSVTSGLVDANGDLILTTKDGTPTNAGHVAGEPGLPGLPGAPGKDAPDLGYVTGLTINTALGWALQDYVIRKIGSLLVGVVRVNYSAQSGTPTITAGTDANISDINGLVTMPAGYTNASGQHTMSRATVSGYPAWTTRCAGGSGSIDLVAGPFPGATIKPGALLYLDLCYWTN